MSEERLEYIKEKVNMRNMANVMCGYNTDKTDNEILELIYGIEKLQQENKQLKEDKKKAIEYIQEDIKGNYFKRYDDEVYKMCDELLEILGDKE